MFSKISALQKAVNDAGVGVKPVLIVSNAVHDVSVNDVTGVDVYDEYVAIIDDLDIEGVSRDLFASGFFSEAVEACFKLLDDKVRQASGEDQSGVKLMEKVFSPNGPIIPLNNLSSKSEMDEQAGYHRLFAGSMLGIRNPCAHELSWIDDPKSALEAIVLAQHLIKKLKLTTAGSNL